MFSSDGDSIGCLFGRKSEDNLAGRYAGGGASGSKGRTGADCLQP